jgi:hypothetical protein
MTLRRRLVTTGLAVALAALTAATSTAAPSGAATRATTGVITFGAYPAIRDGATSAQQATINLQTVLGRQLNLIRVYDKWDSAFPNSYITWLKTTGHTPILSIKALYVSGGQVPLADIAKATSQNPSNPLYQQMVTWATRIKAYGAPIYITLQHEPELSGNGTAADFKAAWINFVSIMRAQNVTNAKYVYIVAAPHYWKQFAGKREDARLWYPGNNYVDVLAVDAFNLYCFRPGKTTPVRPWQSLQTIITDFKNFGATTGKPLFLTEFGTPEDLAVPGRKAQWISDAEKLLQQPGWGQFKAALYWNSTNNVAAPGCDFAATTSSSSIAALRQLGADPYFSAP